MAQPPQLLRGPILTVLLDALRERGVDMAALEREFSIDGDSIPLDRFDAFSWHAIELTGDRQFFMKLGTCVPRGSYGAAEFLWRAAPTFREAWAALHRYQRLVSSVFRCELRVLSTGRLRLIYPSLPAPLTVGRLTHEYTMALVLTLLRELAGGKLIAFEMGLSHGPDDATEALSALLEVKVIGGQQDCWLELDASTLDLPLTSADKPLFAVLTSLMESQLEQLSRPNDLLGEVQQVAEALLSRGELDIDRVARSLRMSERTLQRRLQNEGTSLRGVVDEVRKRRAVQCIADHSLSLSEVSWRLGFSQFTAFARAYKRWTGEAPGLARSRLSARASPHPSSALSR